MKILFISYNGALEPLLQSQGLAYLKGLSNKGADITLLTFEKYKYHIDKIKIKEAENDFKKTGIKWHRLRYHKAPLVLSTIYDMFVGFVYASYLIFKEKTCFVHARSYVPAAIAYSLHICFGVKFIFDMRGMMIDEYVDGNIFKPSSLIYKAGKIMEKKMLLSADRVIVLTERIKLVIQNFDYLKKKKDFKIDVIPCCVDLDKFRLGSDNVRPGRDVKLGDRFIFLYIGSVGTWYFLDGMLDFFCITKEKIPSAFFIFFSPGNKEFIKKAILSKKLSPDDFLVKEASHNDIPDYISDCDAGFIFYKKTFSRQACCPVKFAEYLACGIPVILSAGIGDTEAIVEKDEVGVIVREFSRFGYEKAIDELLLMKKDDIQLRQRCRAVAERLFSLESGIEKYYRVYDSLSYQYKLHG